jgi:hypothetical protein
VMSESRLGLDCMSPPRKMILELFHLWNVGRLSRCMYLYLNDVILGM